jgi:triacylglycerol lipase
VPRRLLPIVVALVAVAVVGVAPADARTAARTARPDPVLLVHGFRGSTGDWHDFEVLLRARGYRASEIAAIDYADDASNVDTARQIARAVAALQQRTGARRVDLVSHSMGAISSRYYVEHLGGAANVDAWVSLAGVNRGTLWAYGCLVLTPCREMVPTSSVLTGLNEGFHAGSTPRFGAWWSPCDEAIVPRTNAELTGAHNVETPCLGHTAVRTDPGVLDQVARFRAAPSAAS